MSMSLALSCRIAEGFLSKEQASLSFEALADLALAAGYSAICMRASQIGVHSSDKEIQAARKILDERGLRVSMISGDFNIVYNNDQGPDCLRNISPYLDLADALAAPLIRVCIKKPEDIHFAQKAADEAARRGLTLLHQCHVQSLFETLDEIESRLREIDRPNFGLIFEAANLQQCGQDFGPSAIARLAPWIQNVYVQNQRLSESGALTLNTWCRGPVTFDVCEIHEPDGLDFSAIIDALNDINYNGPLTVHQSAPEDTRITPLESATSAAVVLRQ